MIITCFLLELFPKSLHILQNSYIRVYHLVEMVPIKSMMQCHYQNNALYDDSLMIIQNQVHQ